METKKEEEHALITSDDEYHLIAFNRSVSQPRIDTLELYRVLSQQNENPRLAPLICELLEDLIRHHHSHIVANLVTKGEAKLEVGRLERHVLLMQSRCAAESALAQADLRARQESIRARLARASDAILGDIDAAKDEVTSFRSQWHAEFREWQLGREEKWKLRRRVFENKMAEFKAAVEAVRIRKHIFYSLVICGVGIAYTLNRTQAFLSRKPPSAANKPRDL